MRLSSWSRKPPFQSVTRPFCRRWVMPLVSLALALNLLPAPAATLPVTGDGNSPSVGIAADGSMVVSWIRTSTSDPNQFSLFARRYSQGQPVGGEFQVSTDKVARNSIQPTAAVDMDPNGNFVFAWYRDVAPFAQVLYRLYRADGTPVTAPLEVTSDQTGNTSDLNRLSVGMAAEGSFVVAWRQQTGLNPVETAVKAQRFLATGEKQGGVITVISHSTTNPFGVLPYDLCLDVRPSGEFVVGYVFEQLVFSAEAQLFKGVVAVRYDNTGTKLGEVEVIREQVPGDALNDAYLKPDIALKSSGELVAIWQKFENGNPDRNLVQARRATLSGPVGNIIEFSTVSDGSDPRIAVDPADNIRAVWVEFGGPTGTSLRTQTIGATGQLEGSPEPVDEAAGLTGGYSEIQSRAEQMFAIAWFYGDFLSPSIGGVRARVWGVQPPPEPPTLLIERMGVNQVRVFWDSASGRTYRLISSEHVPIPGSNPEVIPGTGSTVSRTYDRDLPNRYWRLEVE